MDQYGNYQANLGSPPYPVPTTAFTILIAGNPNSLGVVGMPYSFAFDTVGDTMYFTLNGSTWTSVSGGGGGGSGGLSGVGSPQGSVAASPGTTYVDTATANFWVKQSGSGNTGWTELVGS